MGGEGWWGAVVSKTRGRPAGPESWPGSGPGSLFMYSFFSFFILFSLYLSFFSLSLSVISNPLVSLSLNLSNIDL